jgi:hypothetical protein
VSKHKATLSLSLAWPLTENPKGFSPYLFYYTLILHIWLAKFKKIRKKLHNPQEIFYPYGFPVNISQKNITSPIP